MKTWSILLMKCKHKLKKYKWTKLLIDLLSNHFQIEAFQLLYLTTQGSLSFALKATSTLTLKGKLLLATLEGSRLRTEENLSFLLCQSIQSHFDWKLKSSLKNRMKSPVAKVVLLRSQNLNLKVLCWILTHLRKKRNL